MASGIYIRKPFSEEHKKHLSEAGKGHITWNKGKHWSKKIKRKISLSRKGKLPSKETRQKMSEAQLKEKSFRWKGGRCINSGGYITIYHPDYPGRKVTEHIYIWEKIYGKKVPKGYSIHHLNGIRDDNRPENLLAIKKGAHAQLAEPYKKRIRELELEIVRLKQLELFPKDELKKKFEEGK